MRFATSIPFMCCLASALFASLCLLTGGFLLLTPTAANAQTVDASQRSKTAVHQVAIDFAAEAVFNEVVQLVADNFYQQEFDTVAWEATANRFRERAAIAQTHDEFDSVVSELLATLETSHTAYFSQQNPKHYQLIGIFDFLGKDKDESVFQYEGIGIDTRILDGMTFVTAAYDGLPAAVAGIKFGDQIVEIDGRPFHRMQSFADKAGQSVSVRLIRDDKQLDLKVEVALLDGRTMFETALESSINTYESAGKKIGYVHAWSYAGTKYQEMIRSAVLWGDLYSCDALVLDLRDGWGGADLNYLNLFREPIAEIESTSRTQPPRSFNGVWTRPVAILTNGGSTSGKELFAYGFKKLKLGTIIGERTAGAVVAGRAFPLSNGDLLYLAVTDVHVDGHRLEGVGVEPHVPVDRPIKPFSEIDPQLQKAISVLSQDR